MGIRNGNRPRNAPSKRRWRSAPMLRRTTARGCRLGGDAPLIMREQRRAPETGLSHPLRNLSGFFRMAFRKGATECRDAAGTAARPALLLLGLALGSVVCVQRRLAALRQVDVELRKAGCRDGRRGIVPDAVGTVVGSARRFQRRPVVARLAPLRPGRRRAACDQRRDAGPKHGPAGAAPPTRRPPVRPGGMRTLGHVGFRQRRTPLA